MRIAVPFMCLIASASVQGQIAELPPGLYTREVDADLVATIRASLPEARAVGSEFLDPGYDPAIRLFESASLGVTFIDEGAGYRNSLGWFAVPAGALDALDKQGFDLDGSGKVSLTEIATTVRSLYGSSAFLSDLVFPNASRDGSGGKLVLGDSIDLAGGAIFPAGTEIYFCLFQNAWRNGEVKGFSTDLETTTTMYTIDMLNPESPPDAVRSTDSELYKSRHVAMLFGDEDREQVIMGFEDLQRNLRSDEDFNDAVFVVTSDPPRAIKETDIADAEPAFNPRPRGIFLNPDCCNVDTTNIIEQELPEKTNVNAEFLQPQYTPSVLVSEPTYLVLSFVGEGAIYQNSLGYITYPQGALDGLTRDDVDVDGDSIVEPWEIRLLENVEIGMIFAHASVAGGGGAIEPREAVIVGDREFAAGSRVDFFLVQDGWNENRTVKDYFTDSSGSAMTFYSIDAFNPEEDTSARRHVAMFFADDSQESVLFGFEDLHRLDRDMNPGRYTSDEDFNDNVFCVTGITLGSLSETNVPVAGDSCVVDYNADGELNIDDILAFVREFVGRTQAGDLNNDGVHDFLDYTLLLVLLQTGCE